MATEVIVLDVGHGSCIALHADGMTSLVDAGRGTSILEYLRVAAVERVGRVVISHADQDHVGGLLNLLTAAEFEVDSIWLNADAFKGSQLWRDLSYELDDWTNADHELEIGITDDRSFTTGRLTVRLLAPRSRLVALGPGGKDKLGRRLESNTLSVVAMIDVDNQPAVLVPGDLDQIGLDHLTDRDEPPDLRAPILVFPHHGGHTSRLGDANANRAFTERLIDLVRPEVVLFSTGRGMHATPRPEIVEVIQAGLPKAWVACTQLSEHCAATLGSTVPVTHLQPITARGARHGACCAGSISISFDGGGWSVSPARDDHQAFITTHAPNALCQRARRSAAAVPVAPPS